MLWADGAGEVEYVELPWSRERTLFCITLKVDDVDAGESPGCGLGRWKRGTGMVQARRRAFGAGRAGLLSHVPGNRRARLVVGGAAERVPAKHARWPL